MTEKERFRERTRVRIPNERNALEATSYGGGGIGLRRIEETTTMRQVGPMFSFSLI